MSNQELVDFSLYDEESDGFFTVKVTAARAGELFHDELKSARLIKSLKEQGQIPVKSNVRCAASRGPGAVPKGTGAVPKAMHKAMPFRWKNGLVHKLLEVCTNVRPYLRQKKVPLEVFDSVAEKLSSLAGLKVSGVQAREKMRSLKAFFLKNKVEKTEQQWEFAKAMAIIYDAPLSDPVDEPSQLATASGISSKTYIVEHPNYVTSSSAAESPATPSITLFGTTYVVQHPKFVMPEAYSGASQSASHNDKCPDETASSRPLGTTYIVRHPKFVTAAGGHTEPAEADFETVELPKEVFEDLDPAILEKCTILSDLVPNAFNVVVEASGPIEDLNTTALQSSTLPSETFFVQNLNTKSTPQKENSDVHLLSPPKKKTTTGEGGIRTPKSTPRRKKRYQSDLWLPGLTHFFLKECSRRKEYLQSGNPKTDIWKEISDALTNAGFSNCVWQACREKFESMNIFFEKSLLQSNGYLGQKKWPHYEIFLDIHDLPRDYIQAPDSDQNNGDEEDERLWSDGALQLLISLYQERRHLFKSTKSAIRHTSLYREIAATMKLYEYDRSHKQCHRKMNNLLQEFRKEFDRQKRTGEEPSSWKWYEILEKMEEGSTNLNAPFAFSTGAMTQYSIQGTERPIAEKRTTRTRNTANPGAISDDDADVDEPLSKERGTKAVKPKPAPKKKLYRSWAQEVQEKVAQAKTDMVEEVRQLRLSQVENSASKNHALQTMAEAMVNISNFCQSFAKDK